MTLGNAVFRGMVGGTGAKQAIISSLRAGRFLPSPHSKPGDTEHAGATRITPAEAGLLQTFPFEYPWSGTKTKIGEQIGNCIPPLFAYHILKEVAR